MENKQKRFYKKDEVVWIINLKKEGKVKDILKDSLEVIVTYKDDDKEKEKKLKMWEIDKLKYSARKRLLDSKKIEKSKKYTYFASVKGGVIPTKDEENGGRDCYPRLEPLIDEKTGEEYYELSIPKLTLAKIPLGFASYLNKGDILSLKHERSSIGSTGVINVSGLIDSTYQGEVILQVIPITHDVVITSKVEEIEFVESLGVYAIPYSKAIAQAVVLRQSDAEDKHIEYEELLSKPSKRGTKGWGKGTNK